MDKLPLEVLDMIIASIEDHHRGIQDHHRSGHALQHIQTRRDQLCILARVSSVLHAAVLPDLYREFRQPDIRKKWLYSSLKQNPELGNLVRKVDWEQGHGDISAQLSEMLPSVKHQRDRFRMVMARNLIFLHLALSTLQHCKNIAEMNIELKLQHSDEDDEMLPRYDDLANLPCTASIRHFRLFGYVNQEYAEQTASLLAWISSMSNLETLSIEDVPNLHNLSDYIFLNGMPAFSHLRKLSLGRAEPLSDSCSSLVVAEELLRRPTVHLTDLCLSLADSTTTNTGFKYLCHAFEDLANPKSITRLQLTISLAEDDSNKLPASEAWSPFLGKFHSLTTLHLVVPEWLELPTPPDEFHVIRLWSSFFTQLYQVPQLRNTLCRLTFEQQYIDLPSSFVQTNILSQLSQFTNLENLIIIACGTMPNSSVAAAEGQHEEAFIAFYRKYMKNVSPDVETTIQARFFNSFEIKRLPGGRLQQRTPFPQWIVDDLGWEDA